MNKNFIFRLFGLSGPLMAFMGLLYLHQTWQSSPHMMSVFELYDSACKREPIDSMNAFSLVILCSAASFCAAIILVCCDELIFRRRQ